MRLPTGLRLGPYELLGLLGAGGMGEVYKARDTRLDRTVAIKVLAERSADDPGRRERFEREARAVAALNHPHICSLLDVSEAPNPHASILHPEPVRFLVMEHLEGQTLADRLVRGPLEAMEVLRYGVELADALDHAHRRGLVHRDLKPANVMLTKAGAKLLDFGLSRLQSGTGLLALSTISPGAAPLTAEGALLGTFPYMAPEQLAGRDADARSDIFAFGALLYEMATGRRAFEGVSAATVIGAILHTDPPPPSSVQPLAPVALDRLVSRCMAKDPDDRWQTARDVTLELKWIAEHEAPAVAARERQHRLGLVASAATVVAVLAIAALLFNVISGLRAPVQGGAVRLTFVPPKALQLADFRSRGPVTVSPDGRRLVYVAAGADRRQMLRMHPIDSAVAQTLAGTEGAEHPFWSPDGRFVGFFAQGKLKTIDATAGLPQTLCDVVLPSGGTWSRNDVIVFAANAGEQLYRVPPAGGAPTPLTFARPNHESHWPAFLPDGDHFLYFGRREEPGIYVASLRSNNTTLVVRGLYAGGAYASPGYLVLFRGGAMAGTLLAQRFDTSRLALTGEPTPLAEQVAFYPALARADFSVSENGTLVYGAPAAPIAQLMWVDREGKPLATVSGAAGYTRPSLSPDEKTIAADRLDPDTQSQDVWLIDATSAAASRLTTNPGLDIMGAWSPDGRRIVYGSTRERALTTYVKALSGTDAEDALFRPGDTQLHQVTDWSRDGKSIVYGVLDPKTKWDLWTVPSAAPPRSAERTPVPYLRTEFNEHQGHLSPDGRWMAYVSDQSGRWEVYVDAFPAHGGRRTQVSTDGGVQPQWSRDGKELFYLDPEQVLMAVTVTGATGVERSAPRRLFKAPTENRGVRLGYERDYLPAANGQRFLINAVHESTPSPITVVLNWPSVSR